MGLRAFPIYSDLAALGGSDRKDPHWQPVPEDLAVTLGTEGFGQPALSTPPSRHTGETGEDGLPS